MLKYSEVPDTEVENVRVSYGRALPCCRRKSRINHHKGGFESPVLFYQTLLIRAWYSNELPELEVANSRRALHRPPTGYAHASLRLAATGELGR